MEQQQDQQLQLDVNKIINHLTEEIATGAKERAILNTTIEELREVIEKQKEVIQAYEDKDKVKKLG